MEKDGTYIPNLYEIEPWSFLAQPRTVSARLKIVLQHAIIFSMHMFFPRGALRWRRRPLLKRSASPDFVSLVLLAGIKLYIHHQNRVLPPSSPPSPLRQVASWRGMALPAILTLARHFCLFR